jgi:Raf kinase inhibitor-like YbhB/YbcL family protein
LTLNFFNKFNALSSISYVKILNLGHRRFWMRLLISVIIGLFISTFAYASEFTLGSTNFAAGGMMPKTNTCDKGNLSPGLHWTNAPAKTQSFALVGVAYDSPLGSIYGWVVYNIPATTTGFAAGIKDFPDGVVVGPNSLGDAAYRGPCPPDSHLHHYAFIIYALDANLDVNSDAAPPEVMKAIKSHILQQAELKVIYQH